MASQEDRDQTSAAFFCSACSLNFFFILPGDTMRRSWLVLVFLGGVVCLLYVVTLEDLPKTTVTVFREQRLSEKKDDHQLSAEDSKWLKRRTTLGQSITPLGNWLLSREGTLSPAKTTNRSVPFLIVIWQYGPMLEKRHLRRYSRDKKFSPWDGCSVQNCELSYKPTNLHTADAVIFHLHRTPNVRSLPRRKSPDQRWIFLTDESPHNTFLHRNQSLDDYDGLFNWSMTYRIDSDVPVPYGRTVFRAKVVTKFNVKKILMEKKRLVAVLASNCAGKSKRWEYIAKLKSVLGTDMKILGRCGDKTICPGHFETDCPALSTFKFYLAFENSNCREYLTEKPFWNAYSKSAVPIIMGATKSDCELLLPPHSYLHVDDFASPSSLADYLLYLDRDHTEYLKYHSWRRKYRTINEHGYFGSPSRHYCRVCEALNYNPPKAKIYRRLRDFWSSKSDCRSN